MFSEACKPNSATLFKEKEIQFTTEIMLNDRAVKAPSLSVQTIDTLIYNFKMGKSPSVDINGRASQICTSMLNNYIDQTL